MSTTTTKPTTTAASPRREPYLTPVSGTEFRFRRPQETDDKALPVFPLGSASFLMTSSGFSVGSAFAAHLAAGCVPDPLTPCFPDEAPLNRCALRRLWAGGARSGPNQKLFMIQVLACLSGAAIYAVDRNIASDGSLHHIASRNGVTFYVQGDENQRRVLAWNKRLRCIGDDVFVSLAADEESAEVALRGLNFLASAQAGHPVTLQVSNKP